MDTHKQFDQGKVVSTKDFGFDEDYTIHLEKSYEGGWIANCPECGIAETGETKAEAIQHVVGNLRLFYKQKYKI